MSQYGKIAEDEVIARWEDDVDELQAEDWEDVMGGPDEGYAGEVVDVDYEAEQSNEDDFLETKGKDMGAPSDEELAGYDFTEEELDEYEIMMTNASKRQEEIVAWLADCSFAEPLKRGSRSDFLIRKGCPVRLKDGELVELLAWLAVEGFSDRLMVSGYVVTTHSERKGTGEVMVFKKQQPVDAPFDFDESSTVPSNSAETPIEDGQPSIGLPDDGIPF